MRITDAQRHPRLALTAPSAWRMQSTSAEQTSYEVVPGVTVHLRAQIPMWADYASRIDTAMGAPYSSPRLTRIDMEQGVSARGWPIAFAHYQVHASTGELLSECAGVFYRLLHVGAEIIVRIDAGDTWQAHADTLRPILMSADIEWPQCEPDDLHTLLGMNE